MHPAVAPAIIAPGERLPGDGVEGWHAPPDDGRCAGYHSGGVMIASTLANMARSYSIIAGTLSGNRGAQAMIESVVGTIRRHDPDATFAVFSYYPAADRLRCSDPSVVVHSSTPVALVWRLLPLSLLFGLLRKVLGARALRFAPADIRAIGSSMALVDVAGVSFIDGREKFLPFNLLTLSPAWFLGVPIVKLPQAIGPVEGRWTRIAARAALPCVAVIWARGAQTEQYLHDSGIEGLTVGSADDIAFVHRADFSLTDEGGPAVDELIDRLDDVRADPAIGGVVGVCPSSVLAVTSRKSGGSYEQVLVEVIRELAASGRQVVLFPNATRADDESGERNNDLPVIGRVASSVVAVDGPRPLIVDVDVNAASIKRIITACDVVFVSRFHAMVGALASAVPVVVLGWSHKYAEVMNRFGLEHLVTDHTSLSASDLSAAVQSVLRDRDDIAAGIRSVLPEVCASAARPLQALLDDDLGVAAARRG